MRSLLFIPGDDARKLAKGFDSGADVLLLDLEDSVALARKAAAREVTAEYLAEVRKNQARLRLFVRVNPEATGHQLADLDAVMPFQPDGIILPKSESAKDVQILAARLAVREAENNLPDGKTAIIAIATETAASLFNLGSYAGCSHRLIGLTWGAEDLSADLGAETNRDAAGQFTGPYEMARSLALFGAHAAGVTAIDTVFTAFRDMNGLRRECEDARRDGFSAKMAIHPAQVAVINEIFTPNAASVARAERIIAAFSADPDAGVIGIDGEMIDRPHVRRAERILAQHEAATKLG
jgi:citrate lyase subunit beta / citryl-CoA lyase